MGNTQSSVSQDQSSISQKLSMQNQQKNSQLIITTESKNTEKDIGSQENYEGFVKQAILKSIDNCKIVSDQEMSELPYRFIGYLHSQFKGENYLDGTGVLVAANLVLTAAHNVYHFGVKSRICTFYLAHNKGKSSYVFEVDVNQIFIHKSYSDKGEEDQRNIPFDYALLVLKPNAAFQEQKLTKILRQTNKFMYLLQESVDYESDLHESAIIAGYPKQLNKLSLPIAKSRCQFAATGAILSNKKSMIIKHQISTTVGQSGAPIVVEIDRIKYIIAIHTIGGISQNGGISVRSMKDQLNQWSMSVNGSNIVSAVYHCNFKYLPNSMKQISASEMKQFPLNRMGLVISTAGSIFNGISGCLIAPYLVLTVAQAAYYKQKKSYWQTLQFILNHHRQAQGITFQVDHVLFPQQYIQCDWAHSFQCDYALLVLRREDGNDAKRVSQINSKPFLTLSCHDQSKKHIIIPNYSQQNLKSQYKTDEQFKQKFIPMKSKGEIYLNHQYLSYRLNGNNGMGGSPIVTVQNNTMQIIGIDKAIYLKDNFNNHGVKLSCMKTQVQIWLKYLTGKSIKMEDVPKHNIRELIDSRKVELPRIIN